MRLKVSQLKKASENEIIFLMDGVVVVKNFLLLNLVKHVIIV